MGSVQLWLRKHLIGAGGALIVGFVVLMGLMAPFIAPHGPVRMYSQHLLSPPSREFILGTDEFGRDELSRIIFGARISLWVGIVSVGMALGVGASMGLISGYLGGTLDSFLMRLIDVLVGFPSILLAIALMGFLGPSLTNLMLAIGIVYTPTFARLVRGSVLAVKEREYVQGAKASGARDSRIMLRHILPNVMAPVIVQASLSFSTAVLAEASLSYLGLGIQPPTPSWGTMLHTGKDFVEIAPWTAVFPGLAIFLTVLGFNLLGDGLRDALDPRLRV